ncbi:hypothetical protein FH972_024056 [Carpinus fangiana]|uniref:Uncharacterized protein n=1 Tax=Carpinus fangiana TaxID=176857 RepID=A0A5N6KWX1_9ROSI|nr:hypothetical protein FH972_024056 [Carpinus fangiana]
MGGHRWTPLEHAFVTWLMLRRKAVNDIVSIMLTWNSNNRLYNHDIVSNKTKKIRKHCGQTGFTLDGFLQSSLSRAGETLPSFLAGLDPA